MEGKFASLYPLLSRESVFNEPDFEADFEGNIEYIGDEARVLVVGAGGLGCELLKNLALSGFTDIHLIDLDTIDVSNLNRQFLFRKKDVGRSKAEVAAEFIQQRCKGVKVTSYNRPIQEFRREWYRNFDIIIAGLDNVEARKWLNETLCDLVRLGPDGSIDYDTVIPLIDGGTEGFGGQARLFLPRMSSCFECSLDSLPAGNNHFHLCTIANIPRIPEHCIAWALYLRWPLLCEFNSVDDYKLYEAKDPDDKNPDPVKLDKDDEVHLSWIYNQALGRAQEHGIKGVTFNLTMQVVKNIIPAIASTNALISAECINEALKFRSRAGQRLDNFMMFMGGMQTGTNSETVQYGRNPDCRACSLPLIYTVDEKNTTLEDLYNKLVNEAKLDKPSLSNIDGEPLYMPKLHDFYAASFAHSLAIAGVKHRDYLVAQDTNKVFKKILILTEDGVRQEEAEMEE